MSVSVQIGNNDLQSTLLLQANTHLHIYVNMQGELTFSIEKGSVISTTTAIPIPLTHVPSQSTTLICPKLTNNNKKPSKRLLDYSNT